ncbi:MAG: KOW domain-containing RNA-binding protein [Clostridiales bacterium]|nr:KOW domain-containing RNA-binding protein [Clostridiales bacterium]
MKVWTSRMLAISLAGHDKGTLYVILDETSDSDQGTPGIPARTEWIEKESDTYFLLADGKRRTLEHPKKKKRKHVQVITHLPENLLAQMKEITLDAHIRKILKSYAANYRQ